MINCWQSHIMTACWWTNHTNFGYSVWMVEAQILSLLKTISLKQLLLTLSFSLPPLRNLNFLRQRPHFKLQKHSSASWLKPTSREKAPKKNTTLLLEGGSLALTPTKIWWLRGITPSYQHRLRLDGSTSQQKLQTWLEAQILSWINLILWQSSMWAHACPDSPIFLGDFQKPQDFSQLEKASYLDPRMKKKSLPCCHICHICQWLGGVLTVVQW